MLLNQKEIIYGFLACDVLNTDSSREVIDYNVATILSFSADILASYFDNIGYNWYFLEVSPEYSTFWNIVQSVLFCNCFWNYISLCIR